MQSITRKAYAKINLTLDVTGKRPDGYHTVEMVMQTVSLHDEVTVSLNDSKTISMQCSVASLPTDGTNLAVRAAELFYEHTGITNAGTAISIVKQIPIAAGLAGGSTDAAAVLQALDALHHTALGTERLCEMGLKLGADVPYCIRGGTMLAQGIGEELTALPPMQHCYVVLVKPPFAISTADIYRQMNGGDVSPRPDTAGMMQALEQQDFVGICERLYNVMEPVTGKDHPEIAQIRTMLLEQGAEGAIMSGSGPTVFGLFAHEQTARDVAELLQKGHPDTHFAEILG